MVRKLIAIHRRAVDYIYQNHDQAIAIYAEVWQQDAKDVATYFPKYFGYQGEWSRGGFEKEALDKMSDGLRLIGDADGPVDWKAAIDQRYLPKDEQGEL
jgi:NitT/TauT family transport system substrate-binding protein